MVDAQPSKTLFAEWLAGSAETGFPGTLASAKFCGLDPLAQAWLLSRLATPTAAPLFVVMATHAAARNLVDNLAFFGGKALKDRTHCLPHLDFDYHRGLLPNPETLAERNSGLFHALNDSRGRIFITSLHAILQKGLPPETFLKATLIVKKEEEINRDAWIRSLQEAGYRRQPATYDPGVFSVRGGTIDVFSPLYSEPIRMEFFGDFVEEMRFFDPETQRSLDPLETAYLIPVGLSLLPHGEEFHQAAARIKDRLDQLEVPKARRDEVLDTLSGGTLPADYAFLFPLLSGGSSALTDYFPPDTRFFWEGQKTLLESAAEEFIPRLEGNAKLFEANHLPVADIKELILPLTELEALISRPQNTFFENFSSHHGDLEYALISDKVDLAIERQTVKAGASSLTLMESFARRFRTWIDEGYRIQIVCHTKNHADRIALLFEPYGLHTTLRPDSTPSSFRETDFQRLTAWIGFISESRLYPDLKLALLSEEEIFGQKKRSTRSKAAYKANPERLLSAFRDLKVGDYIVHKDFGVGKYLGLKSMDFLGVTSDYVLLEYKDADKLYIPVYRLNILQKYQGGEGAAVAVDKLGTEQWSKAKAKAEKAIAELAAELLNIQAKRKLLQAEAFSAPGNDYHQFEMAFPYDETPDQLKTIAELNSDLSVNHPMDRLVCGDVGYGKTEIAMRGAARAVFDGKQVAVLVPTTVLAFQHFENFRERFKGTGARVESVSRLRSGKEVKAALEGLKQGQVDIIVGTHRLLSADVEFKKLGLVVIDEEHRFGVAHKERLRRMAENVHLLTMTATPIPRTLNMAMLGIKDISIITTPPPDRLSVRTFVCRRSDEVIVEAISNEVARDGQVFFLHNRVESIYRVGDELRRLLPKIKFEIVHGQMEGDELEEKMLRFYRGEFHVLLTTAIIESGLDIPRANTILIDQAQNLGLAQLYQLKGRVGRSEKRAFCYLLVESETAMTAEAKERLQVIQRYTELGSGFHIASHDLDIRGAGNLLGREQSGHITAIGIDLYMELLEEAIQELRGQEKRSQIEPEINLKVAAYFPESYLPDISERILLYRRLSGAESEERLAELELEVRDRLGTPPVEVVNLFGLMTLKLHLKRMHVVRMSAGPKRTSLQFAATTPASPDRLVKLIQSNPKLYAMTPDQKLVFAIADPSWEAQLREVQRLSALLAPE